MPALQPPAGQGAGQAGRRITSQRRDHTHKLSRALVKRYARLAFEDLNMAGLARSRLARSIHDASWRLLVDLTTYKAKSAGAVVQRLDPRGTARTCPLAARWR
ncbi:IS200/IS605 family accessory protein TnpB-related protein [Methylobacterium sp. E-066]|uniref:IS200/IS605 family accessory protein TnpB-related protein n=1 Tax=Methylobacterium sp. E-066 TaxID=2836584 RepID=UPI001FBB2198|nr:IS200/IS605 family accessory protein TnpB-related protein [Methylobacterium sp. E-066]MCJ2142218.1 IS200/IS605 family accessory protein TnpB-related protein [Methylobacterium sp. E-066]